MNDVDARTLALRWSVAAVGLAVIAGSLVHLLVHGPAAGLAETAVPIVVGLLTVGMGVRLARDDLSPREVGLVALGALGGGVVAAGVGTFVDLLAGEPSVHVLLFVMETSAAIGAVAGTVVGYLYVRERQAGRRATQAREAIESLYAASDQLTAAESPSAITDAVVGIAATVIDVPFAVVWEYDGESETLVPRAASESILSLEMDARTLGADAEGMGAYWGGETVVLEDATEYDEIPDAIRLESALYVPIGGWGLLGVGTRSPRGFSDIDRRLAELLASQTAAELDRVEREGELAEQSRRLQTIVENVPIILFAYDEAGTLTLSEGQSLAALGLDPGEAVGNDIRAMYSDYPKLVDAVDTSLAGDPVHTSMTIGDTTFEVWLEPVADGATVDGVIGVAIDVTEREWRREAIESLYAATERMAAAERPADVAETLVELVDEVLERPFTVYWSWERDRRELVPAAATDRALGLLDRDGLDDVPAFDAASRLCGAFRSGKTHLVDDPVGRGYVPPGIDLSSVLYVPINDHGLLAIGDRGDGFSTDERTIVDLLARETSAQQDRAERESELRDRQALIEALHDTTRGMIAESDPAAVCQAAVDATERLLDLPAAAVFLADEARERLEPVAYTEYSAELFGGHPTFERGDDSLAWQTFESGELGVYDRVRKQADAYSAATPVQSEVIVPLGDRGVFIVGSTDRREFDRDDLYVVRLLAANAEVALERAERESELRTRTSQMEFFNSILRHDVLNGMTVIRSRAEMLAERSDGEDREFAETIVDWSDDVVDIIERVRDVLNTLTGDEPVETKPVDAAALLRTEVQRVRDTYPDVAFETDVADVSVVADDLLSEVFGNLVTNAVEHNDADDPRIRVTLSRVDGTAVARIEDNGSGVPEEMREAVFRRGETGHAKSTGSGFGLFFADSMVEAYGGSIRVEDSDLGGAAFVVELPAAVDGAAAGG